MKKLAKFLMMFGLVSVSAVVIAGTKETTAATATAQASESYTAAGFKQDMAIFKQEMAAKMQSAEAQITALKEKAKVQGSTVKASTIADLESTKLRIKNDLAELDKSSESSWKSMKTKIASAMDSLNTKTQNLLRE